MPRQKSSVRERFMSKVGVDQNGCWRWQGYIRRDGYPRLSSVDPEYASPIAHRISYEMFIGPIPVGLHIDHLCRVRDCVNPAHLEAVTCRENLLRGNTFQSRKHRQTHCIHGHPFDEANTYVTAKGTRRCRTCNRKYVDRYQSANGRSSGRFGV